MKTIFLVRGSTGEYSDHTEWSVAAYETREAAEQHAALLNAETSRRKEKEWWRWGDKPCELDPRMQINYTGAEYGVEELPMVRHVDEFLEGREEIVRLLTGGRRGAELG